MGFNEKYSYINKMDNDNPLGTVDAAENNNQSSDNQSNQSDKNSVTSTDEGSINSKNTDENNQLINEGVGIEKNSERDSDTSSEFTSDLSDASSHASSVIVNFADRSEGDVTNYFENKRNIVNSKFDKANLANNTNYTQGDQDIHQRDENRAILEDKKNDKISALNEREEVVKQILFPDNNDEE